MIGRRLKKLRESADISQVALGKKLGMANTTLSMYESDNRQPDNDALIKIAKFFNCTTDYLLGLSQHPTPKHELGASGIKGFVEKYSPSALKPENPDPKAAEGSTAYTINPAENDDKIFDAQIAANMSRYGEKASPQFVDLIKEVVNEVLEEKKKKKQ